VREAAWDNPDIMTPRFPGPRYHGEPPFYLTSPLLAQAGLPHLFSTRHLPGVRPWRDPRGPFDAGALARVDRAGLPADGFAFARQVHGAHLLVATGAGSLGQADVLMTERPGLPLAIFTADCVPVVVYDAPGRRLAMAHAGWRGTALAAARVAVEALVEAGGRPEGFVAAIGPSIGPCCYEVDLPVIAKLEAAFPGAWRTWVTATRPGKWMLDLWQANRDQLRGAGLTDARIDNPGLCTACRADLFFSYRRGRGEGRLVALAAVPDGPGPAC
jgi:YfiH family protein